MKGPFISRVTNKMVMHTFIPINLHYRHYITAFPHNLPHSQQWRKFYLEHKKNPNIKRVGLFDGTIKSRRNSCASESPLINKLFSSTASNQLCWKCGSPIHETKMFCPQTSCGAIQTIDVTRCNYFNLLGIPERFDINLEELEKSFKDMQKVLHPDKFSTKSIEEKTISNECSSLVNQAYQTLKNPVDRISYILTLRGIHVLVEGDTSKNNIADSELMLEIFSLREKIDEAGNSPKDMAIISHDIQNSIKTVRDELQNCLDRNDLEGLTKAAIRFKYLCKTAEEVDRHSKDI